MNLISARANFEVLGELHMDICALRPYKLGSNLIT